MNEIKDLIAKAEELFEKEKYKEIIILLPDKLLDEYNNADLYAWRASAHNRLHEAEIAFEYANKSIAVNPASFFGYRQRGISWHIKEEYDKAMLDYNKAIELKKDDSNAYNSRGVAWYDKGEYDKAIADYTKAIELKNNYFQAYYNRGLSWHNKGEYDKAIADYTKAIELKNDFAPAYISRGVSWDDKGEYDKAIADYTKAIELKKDDENSYNSRGISWDNKGEYDKAIADYTKAIELKNDYVQAYYNRGISWKNKGEYDRSITDYTKAIELKNDYVFAYNNRGVSWSSKKDFAKAISDYDKAIELKNDYALAYRNRGDVFYDNGDLQRALEDYGKAIQLDSKKFEFLDYKIKLAKEKIEEEKNLDKSKAEDSDKKKRKKIEDKIEKAINTIRKAAKSEVKTVVHYTKMLVADIYVKRNDANMKSNGAKMHYSNAIYMNDPMEGKMLFEYLDNTEIEDAYRFGEKRTETSVYLGSFLPAEENDGEVSHEDELVMWRTYGKDENGKEAAGCCIVLSSDFFKVKKEKRDSIGESEISREELLNVVYIKTQKNKKEIIEDATGRIKGAMTNLKKYLEDLIKLRKKYEHDRKGDFYKDIENIIFKKLSTISYLFKSADYHFEREVRVITYMPRDAEAIKFREQKEVNTPCKRFYIESKNDILPFIKKIYLGPKVQNYQQWSLYFDYEIRQRAKEIEKMTPPPYIIKPSEIEIMKSDCKFQ